MTKGQGLLVWRKTGIGIKEAIEIKKRQGKTMNRDEGQYQLSHIYDDFLVTPGTKSPGKQSSLP